MSLSHRPRAAFFGSEINIRRVYAQGRREILESEADFLPGLIDAANFDENIHRLAEVEAIFSTWGMPILTPEQIHRLPALKGVFYAAGSVQHFARPFLASGITVVSAWAANAVPVAEFSVAQILLANKGFFRNRREYTSPEKIRDAYRGRGNFGATVALLGAGQIGRLVIELLRPFNLKVLVFDPFLSDEAAAELGVEKVSLLEAFQRGTVVSNHLANLPATVKMIRAEHFAAMLPNAAFINTGRGATLAEDELIAVLRDRPDLQALLDVTWPEPPAAGSPLFELPNVELTTHIAGSMGDEVVRMADYMIEEFRSWRAGHPLRFAVNEDMLERMA